MVTVVVVVVDDQNLLVVLAFRVAVGNPGSFEDLQSAVPTTYLVVVVDASMNLDSIRTVVFLRVLLLRPKVE